MWSHKDDGGLWGWNEGGGGMRLGGTPILLTLNVASTEIRSLREKERKEVLV